MSRAEVHSIAPNHILNGDLRYHESCGNMALRMEIMESETQKLEKPR